MPPLDEPSRAAAAHLPVPEPRSHPLDEIVFRDVYPALRRFAAACADRDMDPDDLIQAAVARCLARTSLSALNDPGAYLRVAVLRQASDERRRLGRRRRAADRLAVRADTSDAYPSDLDFLDRLGPLDRSVVYLTHVEGWRAQDVAAAFDISPQAVRARASRARRELRRHLETREPDDD